MFGLVPQNSCIHFHVTILGIWNDEIMSQYHINKVVFVKSLVPTWADELEIHTRDLSREVKYFLRALAAHSHFTLWFYLARTNKNQSQLRLIIIKQTGRTDFYWWKTFCRSREHVSKNKKNKYYVKQNKFSLDKLQTASSQLPGCSFPAWAFCPMAVAESHNLHHALNPHFWDAPCLHQ